MSFNSLVYLNFAMRCESAEAGLISCFDLYAEDSSVTHSVAELESGSRLYPSAQGLSTVNINT